MKLTANELAKSMLKNRPEAWITAKQAKQSIPDYSSIRHDIFYNVIEI